MSRTQRLRVVVGQRLAYYGADPSLAFWEEHWGRLTEDSLRLAASGYLGHFPTRVLTWLPYGERILEAGCGPGTVTLALRARGYLAEGVEWAPDLVGRVRALWPEAPVRVGDVTALDVPDATYGACLSLGVCEHREAGPEPFILELRRVLRPRGTLVVSVPYFHWLRRAVFASTAVPNDTMAEPFYQFAFTAREFRAIIEDLGFEILDCTGYGVWFGLVDDFPRLSTLERVPALGSRIGGLVDRLPFVRGWLGHMVLLVARRR